MYIETVPNRKSKPTILLRESWREGKKTRKRTLANLTNWPEETIMQFRALLKGTKMAPVTEVYSTERSLPSGHVEAILGTIRKLGLENIIAAKPCRERDLVLAMLVERLIHPSSKLATTRLWHTTSLAEQLRVEDADENELYAALDWLLKRQHRIENKLARRHLRPGSVVLYDVSSSSYEGRTCPLARWGKNRDGKKLPCIVYGVLADDQGRPVAVDVYPGNTGDPSTVPDQMEKLRKRFELSRAVLVGDRGMLTQIQIGKLREHPGLGWISALRSAAIRKLMEQSTLQMSLFDEKNLAEISSPDYPGERLVACYNPFLAEDRRRTREQLLEAAEKKLGKIADEVARRTKTPMTADLIGIKVGKALKQHRMGKHFIIRIKDGAFEYKRNRDSIEREKKLDGIYVIRTSEPAEQMSAEDTVRNYKNLSQVEQAFRCLKGVDLRLRPIFLRSEDHVRAHVFLCTLAYYIQWHMRKALAPLLFEDEELDTLRLERDPVAKAKPSRSVKAKKAAKTTPDGFVVHSFDTLLSCLAMRTRNFCRVNSAECPVSFVQHTDLTPLQARAFELLGLDFKNCTQ